VVKIAKNKSYSTRQVINMLELILKDAKHFLDYDRAIQRKIAELRGMSLEKSNLIIQYNADLITAKELIQIGNNILDRLDESSKEVTNE